MSPGRTRWLAGGLVALAAGMQLSGNVIYLTVGGLEFGMVDVFTTAFVVAFATIGALVSIRQPGNAIGWIFLGVAVSTGLGGLAHGLVDLRLQSDPDPGEIVGAAAALADISWVPFVLIPATLLLLLFPDGRLPSRRWRFISGCACAGILGIFLAGASAAELEDFPTVTNPFAVESPALEALEGLSFLLLLIGVVGSAVSVVVRFRHAGSVQRAQIKWLAAAGAVVAVTVPLMAFPLHATVGEGVANGAIMLTVLGLPVAAGIAILRHRLYDIDVVINRALVYGALTATLVGTYVGSVLLLQLILSGATENSSLAVAGSTLGVAALFQPARRRIQSAVDRRFYRRKYDAVRTLDRFGVRVRDEVDLDALGSELRAVVAETMQPARVSLWLRERS